jgi:hypothetical protein
VLDHSDKSRPPRERVWYHRQYTGVAFEGNTVDEVVEVVLLLVKVGMRDESDEKDEARLREYSHHQRRIAGLSETKDVAKLVFAVGRLVERGLELAARGMNHWNKMSLAVIKTRT